MTEQLLAAGTGSVTQGTDGRDVERDTKKEKRERETERAGLSYSADVRVDFGYSALKAAG